MKFAFIVNSYPPRLGGLEQHIGNLAQGLATLGHDVCVVTISSEPGRRHDGKVEVLTGRSHLPIADVITVPSIGTVKALTRFLSERKFDLVSIHTRFFPMSYVGLTAAHRAGIPVIHTEHGSGYVASPSPVIALGSRTVDNTMGRWILRHADYVLGVSPEAVNFAQRLGAPRAEVFFNAIPVPERPSEPVFQRENHLVFVGRMVPGKGWDTFLDAVAALKRRSVATTAAMLGDGADLERARQYRDELGLTDSVEIPGRVDPGTVAAQLQGSTLVNPTVLSEGFQTTLLEAIANSGQVVTYPVPGAELLQTQGAPVAVCERGNGEDLAGAIQRVIEDPLPAAPEGMIASWTWPVRSQQYADIAERVITHRLTNR